MTRKKQRATGIFGLFLAILCLTIILGCPGPTDLERERSIAGTFTYPDLPSATGELSAGQAEVGETKATVPVTSAPAIWKEAEADQIVKYTITPPENKGGPGKVDIDESTGAVTIGKDAKPTDSGTYTITAEGVGNYTLLGTKITASIKIRVADNAIAGKFSYPAAGIDTSYGTESSADVTPWTDASAGQTVQYTITSKAGGAVPEGISVDAATGKVAVAKTARTEHSGTYTVIASGKDNYGGRSTTEVEIKITPATMPATLGAEFSFRYDVISAPAGIPLNESQGKPYWASANADAGVILSNLNKSYTIKSVTKSVEGADDEKLTGLPDGMTLDAKTGEISGQANIEGATKASPIKLTIIITATLSSRDYGDSKIEVDSSPLTFTITPSKKPFPEAVFTYGDPLEVNYGSDSKNSVEPAWEAAEVEKNAEGSYPFLKDVEYSIAKQGAAENAELPDGLSFDKAKGVLTVTDKAGVGASGSYLMTVKATEESDYSGTLDADVPLTVKINAFDLKGAGLTVPLITAFYGEGKESSSSWTTTPAPAGRDDVDYSIKKDGSAVDGVTIDETGKVVVSNTVPVASTGDYIVTATGKGNYAGSISAAVKITINPKDIEDLTFNAPGDVDATYGTAGSSSEGASFTVAAGVLPPEVVYTITAKDGGSVAGVGIGIGSQGKVAISSTTSASLTGEDYTVTATAKDDDPNYTGSATTVAKITIKKRNIGFVGVSTPDAVDTTYGTAKASDGIIITPPTGGAMPGVTYKITKGGSTVPGVTMDGGKVSVLNTALAAPRTEYTVTVTVEDADLNYTGSVIRLVNVTIDKKDIEDLEFVKPSGVVTTYGTAEVSFTPGSFTVAAGVLSPEVEYTIVKKGGSNVDGVTMDGAKVSVRNNVTAARDVDYTVTAKAKDGDPNYEGSVSEDVKITINEKFLSSDDLKPPSDIVDATYGDGEVAISETAASYTVKEAGVLPPDVEYSIIAKGGSAVDGVTMVGGKIHVADTVPAASSGDYTVIATAKATDPNYTGSTRQDVKITITELDISSLKLKVPGNPIEVVYGSGGSTHSGSVALTSADGEPVTLDVDYSIVKKTDGSAVEGVTISVDGKIGIGKTVPGAPLETYTVTATGKGSNPKSISADVTITINKRHLRSQNLTPPDPVSTIHGTAKDSVKAASVDKVDGGEAPIVIYSIKKGSNDVPGVTMTADGKVSVAATAPADVQFDSTQYTVTATAAPTDPNYTGSTTANVIVTIQRKALGVEDFKAPGEVTFTYGKAATSDIVVSHDGDGSPPVVTHNIAKDGGNVSGVRMTTDGKISITNTVSVADSGDYTVQVVAGDPNYFGSVELKVKVTIERAPFTDLGVSFSYPSSTISTPAGTEKRHVATFVQGKLELGTPIEYSLSPEGTNDIRVESISGILVIGAAAVAQAETEFTVTLTVDPSDNYAGGTLEQKVKITVTS